MIDFNPDQVAQEAFIAGTQKAGGFDRQTKGVPQHDPSRNAQIMLMRDRGLPQSVIAKKMGMTVGAVAGVINRSNTGFRQPAKQHFAKRPRG